MYVHISQNDCQIFKTEISEIVVQNVFQGMIGPSMMHKMIVVLDNLKIR